MIVETPSTLPARLTVNAEAPRPAIGVTFSVLAVAALSAANAAGVLGPMLRMKIRVASADANSQLTWWGDEVGKDTWSVTMAGAKTETGIAVHAAGPTPPAVVVAVVVAAGLDAADDVDAAGAAVLAAAPAVEATAEAVFAVVAVAAADADAALCPDEQPESATTPASTAAAVLTLRAVTVASVRRFTGAARTAQARAARAGAIPRARAGAIRRAGPGATLPAELLVEPSAELRAGAPPLAHQRMGRRAQPAGVLRGDAAPRPPPTGRPSPASRSEEAG